MADQGGQSAHTENCCDTHCKCIVSRNPVCLGRWMRAGNALNGLLLMMAAIFEWITSETNFLVILASIYVVVFGALLAAFEARLEMCMTCFIANMGFMFDWRGRMAFYIFAGSLAFGLGTFGIAAASLTIVNMFW